MNKKVLTRISALAITGLILSNSPNLAHASNHDSNTIIDSARTQVSQHFDYGKNNLKTTGTINDKGKYYEIPAYQSSGTGGMKIIKVYKSTGKVTFEDKDTHKAENAGYINLNQTQIHSKLANDALALAIKKTKASPSSLKVSGDVIDKGNYYKILAYNPHGVGGLQVIKVYKSTGKVTLEDNDMHDAKVVGLLDLSKY